MSKLRILVVEDDHADRTALERMVAQEGLAYKITAAGSVSEAQGLLRSGHYDVAFFDYLLGDGTAFDLIALVDEDTPFIFITGSGDEEVARSRPSRLVRPIT